MQVHAMAFSTNLKHWHLALAIFCIFVSLSKFGKAEDISSPPNTAAAGVLANEYLPGQGGIANQNYKPDETGTVDNDPNHVILKALLCFDEKQIYSSCIEAYRLSENGDLNVPRENTDQFCNGPCASETSLVLDCIEGVLSQFKFYNKATLNDVRETIKSGCSNGSKRGNFNVAEHVQEEYSSAHKTCYNLFLSGLLLMKMTGHLLL